MLMTQDFEIIINKTYRIEGDLFLTTGEPDGPG